MNNLQRESLAVNKEKAILVACMLPGSQADPHDPLGELRSLADTAGAVVVDELLQNKQKVLIDNTSVSAESRKSYVGIANQMHKSIGVIFLHTPAATCMERNRALPDPVPERVIPNLAAAIDLPRAEEGFREILVFKGV